MKIMNKNFNGAIKTSLAAMSLVSTSVMAQTNGNDIETTASQIGALFGYGGALLLGVLTLVAVIFVFLGFLRVKANKDGTQQKQGGPWMIIIGMCIAVIPWFIGATSKHVTGTDVDATTINQNPFTNNP